MAQRPETVERRFLAHEVRADDTAKVLYGRCCEYGQVSELIYGYFTEELAPGCFDASLQSGRDIYCTIDHDMDRLLGRQSSGTLKLIPDEKGIGVECARGDYSYAADLVEAIRRKDLRGMSFIFDVIDSTGGKRDGMPHRIVTKADLYEVSFVFFPAYAETSVGVRMAFPVAGERRAIERIKAAMEEDWREQLERCRRRQRLAECL